MDERKSITEIFKEGSVPVKAAIRDSIGFNTRKMKVGGVYRTDHFRIVSKSGHFMGYEPERVVGLELPFYIYGLLLQTEIVGRLRVLRKWHTYGANWLEFEVLEYEPPDFGSMRSRMDDALGGG